MVTALVRVETPYVVVMDGDMTYDPGDIERLLAHAEGYDEILGVRVDGRENIPRVHRFGNWVINRVFNLLMGTNLRDVLTGMYLVRTERLREVEFGSGGFNLEVELATQMARYGRLTEVPVGYRRRVGRRKLGTWRQGFQILWTVVGLARRYNPVFLLAFLSSLFAVPGAALLLWQLYSRLVFGETGWSVGISWLGLIFLIVGLNGFTLSTISLMLKRSERRILQRIGSGG